MCKVCLVLYINVCASVYGFSCMYTGVVQYTWNINRYLYEV